MQKGWIFEIQRFSIHDGPGIRTTVFMKGCPLRCVWCHNPEGIDSKRQLSFLPDKCIGCGYCFRTCPQVAHRMEGQRHVMDREVCRVCGACTRECYAGALELIGREATVQEVLDEVMRDKPFYETSGGGMTLSGGEPLMQYEFSEALLRGARDRGLHNCVETCGFADFARFEKILPYVDQFLYDIKDTDNAHHLQFTGVPNALILDNLRKLHARGACVLIRLPLIPGYNDREDHFRGVAELVGSLPGIMGVDIMPYHPLGLSKANRLGADRKRWAECPTPGPDTVRDWVSRLMALGVRVLNAEAEAAP